MGQRNSRVAYPWIRRAAWAGGIVTRVPPVRSEKSRHPLRGRRTICLLDLLGASFCLLCGYGSVGAERRLLRNRVSNVGRFLTATDLQSVRRSICTQKSDRRPGTCRGLSPWRSMKIWGRSLNTREYACAARPFMLGDCRRKHHRRPMAPVGLRGHAGISGPTDFRSTRLPFQMPWH